MIDLLLLLAGGILGGLGTVIWMQERLSRHYPPIGHPLPEWTGMERCPKCWERTWVTREYLRVWGWRPACLRWHCRTCTAVWWSLPADCGKEVSGAQ